MLDEYDVVRDVRLSLILEFIPVIVAYVVSASVFNKQLFNWFCKGPDTPLK